MKTFVYIYTFVLFISSVPGLSQTLNPDESLFVTRYLLSTNLSASRDQIRLFVALLPNEQKAFIAEQLTQDLLKEVNLDHFNARSLSDPLLIQLTKELTNEEIQRILRGGYLEALSSAIVSGARASQIDHLSGQLRQYDRRSYASDQKT